MVLDIDTALTMKENRHQTPDSEQQGLFYIFR